VDTFVQEEMTRLRIPGVALAVLREGRLFKAKGYGQANVELGVPVHVDTIFQSGSIGKQFTAAAVMLLVEEGKIGLDDPVGKFLESAPEAWKAITVRHLLTHTSGIKTYSPSDLDYRKDYSEPELLRIAAGFPLDFQPGEKWSYSNTGYILLGMIIRRASGKFYGDFLRERVFAPLGMETARVIDEADIVPNRAAGYRLVNGALKNQEWVSPSLNTTADGSLYLTVLDMAKWDAALAGERLLKRASLEAMWTPVTLKDGKTHPYGFGWALAKANGHPVIEHGGAWQGFLNFIARYPDERLTVVVLTNLAGHDPARLAHRIAEIYEPALAGK
jgi:CubicO group peptidase (beta-lactamase class C family)